MANSLDLALVEPCIDARGGTERIMLEIARKYNPVIYTYKFDQSRTYPEFAEFDVRVLPKSLLQTPPRLIGKLDGDARMPDTAAAGIGFLALKLKDDYDAINAHLMPSEWIANRNGRVLWYCHCPCRPAYGWEDYFMAERGAAGKLVIGGAIAAYRGIESAILPKIRKICTNSEFTKRNIGKFLGRRDAQVIRPGIDAKGFRCDGYEKFFLYPSRIVPEKRMEFAIEAFRRFGKKGWKLVIAGHLDQTPRNMAYLESLKKAAGSADVQFAFDLTQEKLSGLYARCYSVLFCGMKEDFGIVPLESMASSKPCISVNEGGPRESIEDGKTGFLVNSPEAMAKQMEFLASHPGECERMGRNGRHAVLEKHTWKQFLASMHRALNETAKN